MLVNIITLHLQLLHKCYMCWSTKFVIKVLKAGMLELVYINKSKMNQFWAGRILSPYLWVPCSAHVLLYYINVIVVHCKVVVRQVHKCMCVRSFWGVVPLLKKRIEYLQSGVTVVKSKQKVLLMHKFYKWIILGRW